MPDFCSTSTADLDAVTVLPGQSPASEPVAAIAGASIGEYAILFELARGGMGVVYVAQHRVIGRRVAIKTMLIGADRNSPERKRFEVEAEAAAKLDHPGIVSIYEVGEYNGEPFLAMKLIDGDNLSKRLQNGPLPVEMATRIAIEVADAIAHAHSRGVIHRDLKPANILLDRQHGERAVITDFGVAKCAESIRSGLTTAGEPIGTPHFMPPEQADASRGEVGPAADIYSIGAVTYTMLTGRPPFQAASSIDVILQVLANDPVPPSRLNTTVPATLESIVMKCLQKDPKHRYKTAADLALDLTRFRNGKPTLARPMNPMRWTGYQLRRHLLVATVSGSGVIMLLIASLTMSVAYFRSMTELMALRQQTADLTEVLSNERNLFRIQLSKLQNRNVGQAEFDVERLASYAELVAEKNPDLATRLAIETVKLTEQGSIAPPEFCVNWLRKLAAASDDLKLVEQSSKASPIELATIAESRLTTSLSDESQRLLGIARPAKISSKSKEQTTAPDEKK